MLLERGLITLVLALLATGLAATLATGRLVMPLRVRRSWIVGTLLAIDSGALRVMWTTYQIVQSISYV